MVEIPRPVGRRVGTPSPGQRLRAIPARWLATLCLLASAVAMAACGTAEPQRVSLVPLATSTSGEAHWTAECRFGPRHSPTNAASPTPVTRPACDPAPPIAGLAQLAGNTWNLGGPNDAGSVQMAVDATGALAMRGDLTSAPPCTSTACVAPEANTWVRGYPSVLYGIDQCNAATSPPQSDALRLPATVSSLRSGLVGTTSYDTRASAITYDVAYDLWLNPSDTPTPCRNEGTLEVMVWTDHDARALLPDSMRVTTATVPIAVNGKVASGRDAWSVYVSNVFDDGRTAPWGGTVWLVPNGAALVRTGTIAVDLGAALHAVATLLETHYGWKDVAGTYWLDTIVFGIEVGPDDGSIYGTGPIDFGFDLTAYCLARTTVAKATC